MRTRKPLSEFHKFRCPALLKLDRRQGEEKWVIACNCGVGHLGSHESNKLSWEGDDR